MSNDDNPYAPVVQAVEQVASRGLLPRTFWIVWATLTLLSCGIFLTPMLPLGVLGITSSIVTLAYTIAYAYRVHHVQRRDCIDFLNHHPFQFTISCFALSIVILLAGLIGFCACCTPLTIGLSLSGLQRFNESLVILTIVGFSILAGLGSMALLIRITLPARIEPTFQSPHPISTLTGVDPSEAKRIEDTAEKKASE